MSHLLKEARDRFLALAEHLPSTGELARLREAGRSAFSEQGLPSTRLEEWRYTSVLPLAEHRWTLARPGDAPRRSAVEAVATPLFACSLEVFVDGLHVPDLDGAQAGGEIISLAGASAPLPLGSLADAKVHPFVALNGALVQDGAGLRLRSGPPRSVHLVFAEGAQEAVSHPRVAILAEAGSRATVIVDHVSLGEATHFSNAVIELLVEEEASLDLVLLQRTNFRSFHVGHLAARIERAAQLRTHTITLGGGWVRNDASLLLAGEGAECSLHGLYLGLGEQLIDNHTCVDHAVPHGRSDELYKGVLGDRARGVFRGLVQVRPDAQKTDARQSNPNLLLGDGAEIDTKPQLEIHADDVKCSHGAAIGRLDPEALFYLRSRGIGKEDAHALLVRGFAAEILQALPEPALAEDLEHRFAEGLASRGLDP